MSDVIKFDTEDSSIIHELKTFDLVDANHPILKTVLPEFDFNNSTIDPKEFASSLVETCIKNKGLGLSSNQCGFNYRVFVMGSENEYVAFFNPKILNSSGECHMIEGCLSFPFLGLKINRAEKIDVQYQDYNGKIKTATYTGISARVFQHELDHMNGIVFTSKAKPMALQMGMKKSGKIKSLVKKMNKNLEKINGHTN